MDPDNMSTDKWINMVTVQDYLMDKKNRLVMPLDVNANVPVLDTIRPLLMFPCVSMIAWEDEAKENWAAVVVDSADDLSCFHYREETDFIKQIGINTYKHRQMQKGTRSICDVSTSVWDGYLAQAVKMLTERVGKPKLEYVCDVVSADEANPIRHDESQAQCRLFVDISFDQEAPWEVMNPSVSILSCWDYPWRYSMDKPSSHVFDPFTFTDKSITTIDMHGYIAKLPETFADDMQRIVEEGMIKSATGMAFVTDCLAMIRSKNGRLLAVNTSEIGFKVFGYCSGTYKHVLLKNIGEADLKRLIKDISEKNYVKLTDDEQQLEDLEVALILQRVGT